MTAIGRSAIVAPFSVVRCQVNGRSSINSNLEWKLVFHLVKKFLLTAVAGPAAAELESAADYSGLHFEVDRAFDELLDQQNSRNATTKPAIVNSAPSSITPPPELISRMWNKRDVLSEVPIGENK